MNALCRVTLFGTLQVTRGEEVIHRFRTHKAAGLLAYLALHLSQTHARERLLDIFWADMDIEAGRDNLSTALSSLRRQLEPAGTPPGSVLLADRQTVRLNPATVTTDVAEFDALLQQAERAESAPQRLAALEQALALAQGELLPGHYDDWATLEQTRWAERIVVAWERLGVLREEAGDLEGATEALRRVTQLDPYREDAYAGLMQLYAAQGRVAEAKKTYDALERFLQAELGAPPSETLLALLEEISAAPASAARPILKRARLATPERPASPPPPVVTPTRTATLPMQLTRFFGRERELNELTERLTNGVRLMTLLGPGGAGKTRLSIETASRVAAHFAGRVWFVPLGDISDPALIPSALSNALQIPAANGVDPLERIVQTLGDEPCLLALDNLEHLLHDAPATPKSEQLAGNGASACIRTLLERVPGLACLATSRQPLRLAGEQEVPLSPLPLPTAPLSPEELLRYDSIALYADRARAAKPDFALTPNNAEAVVALCRKLEGMPLAIEMAAAWAKMLPPSRMLERLERQLDLLVSRHRDVSPRHQSLRATIEWSYTLLTAEQQTLFARLSVFRGGWTLESAEAIVGDELALACLSLMADLQEQSLIVVEERETETRYRMLEPLREYALEKLQESGAETPIRRAHALRFLELARDAEQAKESAESQQWIERLEAEHDNLRAAMTWGLENDSEIALGLGSVLWRFWEIRGRAQEGKHWLLRALAKSDDAPKSLRADVLNGAGMLLCRIGDYEQARDLLQQSVALRREIGEERGIASSLHALGIVASHRGEMEEARACYEQCLEIRERLGDPIGAAGTLNNLGNVVEHLGDFVAARSYYERSLETHRRTSNHSGIAIALTNLGRIEFHLGEWERAERHQQESLSLSRELGYKRVMRYPLQDLGHLARARGDFVAAQTFYLESLQISQEIGFRNGVMETLLALAYVAHSQERTRLAAQMVGASDGLRKSLGLPMWAAEREAYETLMTELTGALGEREFGIAYNTGADMPIERVLELAQQ